MSKSKNELEKYTGLNDNKNNDKISLIPSRIDRTKTSFISLAQFKLDTDKSIYEHFEMMQGYWDENFDKIKFKNKDIVNSVKVVCENRNHKTEIIFEGLLEPTGKYEFNAQTEKVKDTLEDNLVNQYKQNSNPTIYITISDLAKEINVNKSDLRKKICYIIESLETIRLSYKTKNKNKNIYSDFASIRIISSKEYHEDTDILEINFDNKYARALSEHKYFQLPKKYREISDNSYRYAYPLAKYIFELCRNNRNEITFGSLYNRILKIPRIETIKKQRASVTQKIYEPLLKHFEILNEQKDFKIEFENEDFLLQDNLKKNIDFEKMLETKIKIKWINKPQKYENIENKKEKYKKIAEKNEEKKIKTKKKTK